MRSKIKLVKKKDKNFQLKEPGTIISFFSGIARIQGLKKVFVHETLLDGTGLPVALVIGFDSRMVEALFFSEKFDFKKPVFKSGQPFKITVSENITGRVVNGFGQPLDELGPVPGTETTVFNEAPPIIKREPVTVPLSTGIKIIDTNLPLGRGQRELIIGDRKLGKSTIAADIVLNQKQAEPPMKCVYVMCGSKLQKIRGLTALFEKYNAFLYTTIVAASAEASFAEKYLAPFVGCAIGEYFRDKGEDALVIYDDLSVHARNYRDIALLLERSPGREAYPGDIFSLHAKLLERAARLSAENGGGSLTALPIIETQEGDITSFIATNIISITDGQIYLEAGLFQKGFLPAVNVGLSVSRVGSTAQPDNLEKVVGGIRLSLSQHKELQKLSQLETVVSDKAKQKIHRGELILELLKQEKHTNIKWPEQAVLFFTVQEGYFDDVPKAKWQQFENLLLELIRSRYQDVLKKVEKQGFNQTVKNKIQEIVIDFKQEFIS